MTRYFVYIVASLLAASCAIADPRLVAMHDLIANQQLNMPATDLFDRQQDAQLADAVGRGDLDRAQQALAQGANVNAVGLRAMTPLLWAMGKRNLAGFQFLLEHGASPNAVTCCDERAPGMVHKLSAMGLAARIETSTYLQLLIDNKGNPNLTIDELDETPIFSTLLDRRTENAKLLIAHGANLNHQTAMFKGTPLIDAVDETNFQMALLLLKAGADPTIKDGRGADIVDRLLKRGNRPVLVLKNPPDLSAYKEFVTELKKQGLLQSDPPDFGRPR